MEIWRKGKTIYSDNEGNNTPNKTKCTSNNTNKIIQSYFSKKLIPLHQNVADISHIQALGISITYVNSSQH